MDNNYENLTTDADFALENTVSQDELYDANSSEFASQSLETTRAFEEAQALDAAEALEAMEVLEEYTSADTVNVSDESIPSSENTAEPVSAEETVVAVPSSSEDKKKNKKDKREKVSKSSLSYNDQAQAILRKRKGKKFHLLNFSRRLAILCIVPLILLCIIISTLSSQILTTNLEKEIEGSLKIVATSLEETYSTLYEGDYFLGQDGKLYKGDTALNNTALLDSLKENTGFESSFYYGDRVIITSILRMLNGELAGGRLSGNKHMPEDVLNVVMTGEEVFRTDFILQETEYYAYFKPLINSDGQIVGCIFAGKPSAEVNAQIKAETNKITLFSALISIACVVLILFISNKMSKNMVQTKSFLEVVSTGDLRQNAKLRQLKRDDELGDMYAISYSLQEELKKIVTNIKISADDLAVSSDDLLQLSQNTANNVTGLYDSVEFISKGATDQADQTSVAAIQVSNIGDQIDSIAEDVTSLTESATKMSSAEKASTSIINELNASNEEMIDSIEKIATQIEVTNSSIQDIRAAIAMIQSISDETDLLSINASIEAAHAGDAGRGFAVVAEQISKLAAHSGKSATEIEDIINALLDQSNLMVHYMDDVKIKISEQREKLDMTIDKFSAVASGVDSSLVNIGNITNGMNELRKSRDVILDVISDLSAVSQQYAASTSGTIEAAQSMNEAMEAVEEASKKLKAMSDGLTHELEIFKLS